MRFVTKSSVHLGGYKVPVNITRHFVTPSPVQFNFVTHPGRSSQNNFEPSSVHFVTHPAGTKTQVLPSLTCSKSPQTQDERQA